MKKVVNSRRPVGKPADYLNTAFFFLLSSFFFCSGAIHETLVTVTL
jgi:hypothetical protein